MTISPNSMPYPDSNIRSTTPVFISMYMLDAGVKGKLFSFDTYTTDKLIQWMTRSIENITKGIVFPSNFTERSVLRKLVDKMVNTARESNLVKMFEAIDAKDIDSIKKFTEKNRKEGEESLQRLESFLRRNEFPPYLWMEFSRFERVFIETSEFMAKRVDTWFKLKPRGLSQVRQRSKQTRWMARPYALLIGHYLRVMLALLRMYVFMEVWSCETENELFTTKPWTFEKIKPDDFEPIFLEFHNSVSELRMEFFRFKPEKVKIEFAKPTEWAFKQLIQMVEV